MYLFAMKSNRSEGRGRKVLAMVGAVAAVVGCGAAVEAATLTNVTAGKIMFDTGWETGTAGSSTEGTPGGHVSTDTPLVGTFTTPREGAHGDELIFTDHTYSGTTVEAYTGNQFAATFRRASDESGTRGNGAIHGVSSNTVSSDTGDTISLAVAFYQGGGHGRISFYDEEGNTIVWVNLISGGEVRGMTSPSTYDVVEPGFNLNAWNTLEITYVNGADTASVSVNGGESVSFEAIGAGNVHSFQLQNNGGGEDRPFYWDSVVPEPASVLLLGTGAPLILFRRAGRP